MFKKFMTYVETQFQTKIETFSLDSGAEYMCHEF